MTKWSQESMLDGSLIVIRDNAVNMAAVQGEALTLENVNSPLGTGTGMRVSEIITMQTGAASPDYPISNEGTSPFNRKIDVASKTNIDVDPAVASATPDHIALWSATEVLYRTTITNPPSVVTTTKLTFPSWRIIIPQQT